MNFGERWSRIWEIFEGWGGNSMFPFVYQFDDAYGPLRWVFLNCEFCSQILTKFLKVFFCCLFSKLGYITPLLGLNPYTMVHIGLQSLALPQILISTHQYLSNLHCSRFYSQKSIHPDNIAPTRGFLTTSNQLSSLGRGGNTLKMKPYRDEL